MKFAEPVDSKQIDKAIQMAQASFKRFRKSSRYLRSQLLYAIRDGLIERKQEFIDLIVSEALKPIAAAEVEFTRALTTFNVAAEEAKRYGGEVIPIDIEASGQAYSPAISYWVPRGPVLAITPFNFPLNLVAHKVAPALAVGTSVVLKPALKTPGPAFLLAEVFEKACLQFKDEIPKNVFQVVLCSNELVQNLVIDPRLSILSFTGSDKVGWMLQSLAVRKKVLLELGGNAAVIVHKDADLARASVRCGAGRFGYSGQSCISVQRIYVYTDVAQKFEDLFLAEVKKLKIGPLIDSVAADRVMEWIDEAKRGGAEVLTGGKREGNIVFPTVLKNVNPKEKVVCEEVFGPVAVLFSYKEIQEAIDAINDSRFGLQAGIFSDSNALISKAVAELEVGGIMVNEIPTFRADNMPYGGVKDSGLGREGVRYTMEEYSERRTVVTYRG